jgi:hypothetical protein
MFLAKKIQLLKPFAKNFIKEKYYAALLSNSLFSLRKKLHIYMRFIGYLR